MKMGTKINDDEALSTPLEKIIVGLMIAILIAVSVIDFFKIERALDRNRSRDDSRLESRITECERQIAFLKDRVEKTREDEE